MKLGGWMSQWSSNMASESKSTRKKHPFELLPTSMKGAYSFAPPPKGVDLRTASRRTLLKHGILFRRPDREREPELFALWNRFVEEIWNEKNFNLPTFGPSPGIPHNLKGLRPTEAYGVYQSDNWSGCMVVSSSSSSWVGAWGVWQVPTVSQPTTPAGTDGLWQSASWVGLNGGGRQLDGTFLPGTYSTDVLQAGVAQNVYAGGYPLPQYYAWFEWVTSDWQDQNVQNEFPYVLPRPITSVPVNPGDTISVVVQFVPQIGDTGVGPIPPAGPYVGAAVLLVNVTTGQSFNLYLNPPTGASFAGDTAEWIMECPTGPGNGTLPQFSSVTFQNASACDALDAPPESSVGVDLGQSGNLIEFVDSYGNVETNESAGEGTVTINYQ
jgi:hypothetical protein